MELPVNKILVGDCRKVMAGWPDGCVDLVLADPPYFISKEVTISRGRNKMKFKGPDISMHFGNWDVFEDLDDFMAFTFDWLAQCVRVLRPGGMLCSYFDRDRINYISSWLQKFNSFKFKDYFADLKSNPVPQARKVKWMSGWEIIGMWQKPGGKLTYNYKIGQQANCAIRPIVGHTTAIGGDRVHTTQKPVGLMMMFIDYWTNPDGLVLDCFAGSGTTLVAAKKLGRQFIGIEKNPDYCKIAEERLRAAEAASKEVS